MVELLAYILLDESNCVSLKLMFEILTVVEYILNICVLLLPEIVMFLFSSPMMFNEFMFVEYLLRDNVDVKLYVSVNESVIRYIVPPSATLLMALFNVVGFCLSSPVFDWLAPELT